jgi:hypothetical protein
VALDLDRVPAEGLELGAHVAGVHDLLGGAVGLEVVVVDDRSQVREVEVGRGGRGLPGLALLAITVGEEAERLRGLVEPVEAQGQADPHAHRQALAERSRRDLHTRGGAHVRMALEHRADLAELLELGVREVAVLGKRRVEDRRGVALGEDEAVALGPVGPLRVVAEDPEVERGDDVSRRERAVEVAGLGDREHPHAVDPQHGGPALELGRGRSGLAVVACARGRLQVWDGPQVPHLRIEVTGGLHERHGMCESGRRVAPARPHFAY